MNKLWIFIILFVWPALAATEDPKNRDVLSDKARARLYDGGMDEQPLVVQQGLVEPRTDGSESLLQRKLLNNDDTESAEPSAPSNSEETPTE